MHTAAAAGDYRLATGFQDFLFAVEPKSMSLEEATGGTTLAEKAAFFVKHGCIVVPQVFEGDRLAIDLGRGRFAARCSGGPSYLL